MVPLSSVRANALNALLSLWPPCHHAGNSVEGADGMRSGFSTALRICEQVYGSHCDCRLLSMWMATLSDSIRGDLLAHGSRRSTGDPPFWMATLRQCPQLIEQFVLRWNGKGYAFRELRPPLELFACVESEPEDRSPWVAKVIAYALMDTLAYDHTLLAECVQCLQGVLDDPVVRALCTEHTVHNRGMLGILRTVPHLFPWAESKLVRGGSHVVCTTALPTHGRHRVCPRSCSASLVWCGATYSPAMACSCITHHRTSLWWVPLATVAWRSLLTARRWWPPTTATSFLCRVALTVPWSA